MVSRYIPHVAPRMANHGLHPLPRNVNHSIYCPGRSQDGGYATLLAFHIGDAITLYHELVRTGEEPERLWEAVELVSRIADQGYENFTVAGDILTGFYLKQRA